MKTLVIHPKDKSTDFLCPIYADKGWTVIDAIHPQKKLLKQAIKDHDRIIMLGHGTDKGLMNINMHTIIDSNMIYLLKDKFIISIWCHSDQFMTKYDLKGFYTGMFISDLSEAHYYGIFDSDEDLIDKSNDKFAKALAIHIDDIDLDKIKDFYNNDDCSVTCYNNNRLKIST